MSAGILQGIEALLVEIDRLMPERWPELGSLPEMARERMHRALADATRRMLEARLAAARSAPWPDIELELVTQGVRMQLAGLELELRHRVARERWHLLAELLDYEVIPWLEDQARVGLAALVAALEERLRHPKGGTS